MSGNHVHRSRPYRRARTSLFAIVVVVVLVSGWSYVGALTSPGSSGFGVRSVEWVRANGGASLVRTLENAWYSLNAPKRGGEPPANALKSPVSNKRSSQVVAIVPHLPPPRRIDPFVKPALANEGVWTPEGLTTSGYPGLYVTLLRPDPVHTSLVAGVAWFDPHLVSFLQFAGAQQPPGGQNWPYMAPIAASLQNNLVAAFNSGFRMQDAAGGYYAYGQTAVPLVNGAASFVISQNGVANIVAWTYGSKVPSAIAVVRQNLSLVVNNGSVNPGVDSLNFQQWGSTVNNAVLVWRSGVGVTANGAIVYVAGEGLSVRSLATLLVRAGAVRAMELDINSAWTDFFYFNQNVGSPAQPANGSRLVYNMERPPQRYFEATARDFVAAFARPTAIAY